MATPPLPPPPPLPPGKKLSPIVLILIVVGGLVVLSIMAVAGMALFVFNKVKDNVHITTDSHGNKTGSLEVQTKDGTLKLGGGNVDAPSWVPEYPGAKPQGLFHTDSPNGTVGMFTFKTGDAPEKVVAFYKDAFDSAGMTVLQTMTFGADSEHGGTVTGASKDKDRQITITVGTSGGETNVSVTHTSKK